MTLTVAFTQAWIIRVILYLVLTAIKLQPIRYRTSIFELGVKQIFWGRSKSNWTQSSLQLSINIVYIILAGLHYIIPIPHQVYFTQPHYLKSYITQHQYQEVCMVRVTMYIVKSKIHLLLWPLYYFLRSWRESYPIL
jgi:hypothetical protein